MSQELLQSIESIAHAPRSLPVFLNRLSEELTAAKPEDAQKFPGIQDITTAILIRLRPVVLASASNRIVLLQWTTPLLHAQSNLYPVQTPVAERLQSHASSPLFREMLQLIIACLQVSLASDPGTAEQVMAEYIRSLFASPGDLWILAWIGGALPRSLLAIHQTIIGHFQRGGNLILSSLSTGNG
jgi:hypothetical protein